MKGVNGVQMQVHPKFQELMKDIKDERVKLGKERSGELGNKRLSLTLVKLFNSKPEIYDLVLNAEINLKEE